MLPNVRNFYRPREVAEAVKLLASDTERNVVLGGGTSLALSATPGVNGLVDLQDLGLNFMRVEKNLIVLGSCARPNDLVRFDGLQLVAGGIVAAAASNYLAEVQRNRASLGGILISGSAWADLATALLAVGGEIIVATAEGDQTHTLDTFFKLGPAKVASRAIIRELRLPAGGSGAYQRIAKTETDASILSVAARVDVAGGKVASARIAVGGVGPVPVRLDAVEKALVGTALSTASAEAASKNAEIDALDDFRASAEYRSEMTQVLVKRVLTQIAAEQSA